ncbi:hypothetical protein [Desulfobacula sp.]|uniref:DUF6812 domain-containing protein n=1 Tax=Desulfobacula sp. TaxID=2593537 RepID=UPI0025B9F2BA|nr:hypothetical protein [Desulfobacula sp.]MBC2705520.1 hypothetical protein [Desulfobacula sp.]
MGEQTQSKEIKGRSIRIRLIDGSQVSGQVNINRDPGYDRASDLVTSYREPFLILFNVTINRSDLEDSIKHKALFLNKSHIIWAAPDDTQK